MKKSDRMLLESILTHNVPADAYKDMNAESCVKQLKDRMAEASRAEPAKKKFLFEHHTGRLIDENIAPIAEAVIGKAGWQKLAEKGKSYRQYGSVFNAARAFPANVHRRMAPALQAYGSEDMKYHGDQYANWMRQWVHMVEAVNSCSINWQHREDMVRTQAKSLLRDLYDLTVCLRKGTHGCNYERAVRNLA